MVSIDLKELFSKISSVPSRTFECSGRPGPQFSVKDGALEGRSLPSPKGHFVEEFSHFCECPRCFDLLFTARK